jgi:hypothetical protein
MERRYHVAITGSLRSSGTWMAGYRWLKDPILKTCRPFTLPTGIHLATDSIMRDSFGVAARVASPAVQGLWPVELQYTNILCMFWFLCKFNSVFCPVIVFRLESTIDGEIWHLKPFHKEFLYSN